MTTISKNFKVEKFYQQSITSISEEVEQCFELELTLHVDESSHSDVNIRLPLTYGGMDFLKTIPLENEGDMLRLLSLAKEAMELLKASREGVFIIEICQDTKEYATVEPTFFKEGWKNIVRRS